MVKKKFDPALTVERVQQYFIVGKKKVVSDIEDHTLSLFPNPKNKRLIDFAEANRVYVLRPEYEEEFSNQNETGAGSISKDVSLKDIVEREKLVARNEALTEMLEQRASEVEYLRKELSKSSNLLSDQRSNTDKEAERKMQEQMQMDAIRDSMKTLEAKNTEQIEQLKRQNRIIRSELHERQKSLWAKLFGAKPAQRRPVATRKQSAQ